MNQAATEMTAISTATATATATAPTGAFRRADRSLVIGQLRANPFRVLRLGLDIGVDSAIWKAEEALTRLRAGLSLDEPDLLPWLPEPDEPEIRQAIQRIEEPLRRLADELAWFDPDADPDGDLLRRALVALDPTLVNDYLARCEDDGLPRPATSEQIRDRILADVSFSINTTNGDAPADGKAPADGEAPADLPPDPATGSVPRLLNHANLRLLLATLALYDALPDGLNLPGGSPGPDAKDPTIRRPDASGPAAWENPHELDPTGGRRAARDRTTAALWRDAVARWLRLVQSPAFLASVRGRIARLGDEVVGDDDAEAIVNAASSRILDLLVGEVKAQFLAGRPDRVRALMDAAGSSERDPRRWAMAFRQLRPLFRTATDELEPLLPDADDPRYDDAALYLSRLRALLDRWRSLDPIGLLGLGEIGDEAVSRACGSLAKMENFQGVDRLKALYADAMGLASADSLKQRIAATVGRIDGLENYACHFCRSREMEPNRSIVITGKKESHRTYGFNSTTVHYTLNAALVPRCPRCSALHAYFWENGETLRAAMWVAAAGSLGFMYWMQVFGRQAEPIVYLWVGGAAALVIWLLGFPARWISAWLATPTGERRYWTAKTAKPYRDMSDNGSSMSIDYRRDAFERFNKARAVQG
jgi:hypothetical protein